MLTFRTLFLGLVYDIHPVELSVTSEVAATEVSLNGEQIGKLTGEPWTLDCDFGEALRRELDAQWIAWVEGSHLPQDIQLVQSVKGLKLAM